ncbi:hypothetical protein D3C81_858990 [compost metagenome]
MHITEETLREYAITTHYIHQTRNTGVRCHARSQHGHAGEHQDHRLEELAGHVQHDFRLRRVRIFEARDVREVQLHEVRHHNEDDAADQCRQEDGFRDHFLCVFGFLRQRADAVKPEEREAQNGRTGNHRHHVRILRPERTAADQRARAFAVGNTVHHQAEEHDHDRHLHYHDDGVQVRHQLDAAQVEKGHQRDQRRHENP